jgi:8-hydroxy-5-deazaflavin:NADPH oxidoreductase
MNITILGTGSVGQALAKKLLTLDNNITIGTRDVEATLTKTELDGFGNPPISKMLTENPKIQLRSFKDSVAGADLVILAVSGRVAIDVLASSGELPAGMTIIDTTNPLDFSNGFPPSLFTESTTSLAEQIQEKFPHLNIVKCFNTMSNAIMINPQILDESSNIFVAGNDEKSRDLVKSLIFEMGWSVGEIVDLGDITAARGLEMIMPLWLRIFQSRGDANFNFKIAE